MRVACEPGGGSPLQSARVQRPGHHRLRARRGSAGSPPPGTRCAPGEPFTQRLHLPDESVAPHEVDPRRDGSIHRLLSGIPPDTDRARPRLRRTKVATKDAPVISFTSSAATMRRPLLGRIASAAADRWRRGAMQHLGADLGQPASSRCLTAGSVRENAGRRVRLHVRGRSHRRAAVCGPASGRPRWPRAPGRDIPPPPPTLRRRGCR